MPTPIVALHAVSHCYVEGRCAIKDLNLVFHAGERVALIGPSGAGKSTLLATLSAALAPSKGSLDLFEQNPWTLSTRARQSLRKRLFLAPQTPPLPPRQRAVHAVLAGRLPSQSTWQALRSLIKPLDSQLAADALQQFAAADKLFLRVDQLSGGERQRVGLARAVLSSAEILCFDEPISALDPTLSHIALTAIQTEAKKRNALVICGLHDVSAAIAYFDRVIALRDGLLQFDSPADKVTPEMLAELYANEHRAASTEPAPADEALPLHACQ
jgi:phosphonate transport system ATP-binding protein